MPATAAHPARRLAAVPAVIAVRPVVCRHAHPGCPAHGRRAGLRRRTGHDAAAPDDSMLDHVFRTAEFVIRHGAILWTDEQRGAPSPSRCGEVDLVMRNRGRRHELRLDAPRAANVLGEALRLAARSSSPSCRCAMAVGGNGRRPTPLLACGGRGELKRYVDIGVDLQRGARRLASLGRSGGAVAPSRRTWPWPTWPCASIPPLPRWKWPT